MLRQPFNDQYSHHIETSQLICRANQLTGFYMMRTLVVLMKKGKTVKTVGIVLPWENYQVIKQR